jgi:hypothetical protein
LVTQIVFGPCWPHRLQSQIPSQSNQNASLYSNAIFFSHYVRPGVSGGAAGWGTAPQTGRSRVWFPMESLEFFSDLILPVALSPLTEISTRNHSWG